MSEKARKAKQAAVEKNLKEWAAYSANPKNRGNHNLRAMTASELKAFNDAGKEVETMKKGADKKAGIKRNKD